MWLGEGQQAGFKGLMLGAPRQWALWCPLNGEGSGMGCSL